jgi:hypothetical protein
MEIQASAFETDGNSAVSFKTSPTFGVMPTGI